MVSYTVRKKQNLQQQQNNGLTDSDLRSAGFICKKTVVVVSGVEPD